MKIIIVGGGIAGLSTYLYLLKYFPNAHLTIYESHAPQTSVSRDFNIDNLSASTTLVGGGLGISPNGMRVLRDLDKELHDEVAAQGFPVEHFVFKGANGWTLGEQRTGDQAFKKKEDDEEICISSSRHGLWETLMKSVGKGVVRYRKVVRIQRDETQGRVMVELEDSEGNKEVDIADLLVGADGTKSVVRTALFGVDKFKPTYTGQSGVGGFLSKPIPEFVARNKAMVFTFGRNGFFGYSSSGPVSTQSLMWWSTFETLSLPYAQNLDVAKIKADLVERHKHWKDPIVQGIIEDAEVQSIYPTWVLPELPHWGENGIVLVGDAAHAMDPTTGQGASQALEDSQTLALLLAGLLKENETIQTQTQDEEKAGVTLAIKLYHKIRSPRVQDIVERGKKISGSKVNVGVVAEYFMYFLFWMMMRYPAIGRIMLGDVNRKLYAWSAVEEIRKELRVG